ncbi:MAG: cobalamin-dependent protein [Proteobacteria bacterium]|nr:cobalamin-dependent protein [Pseudomonadota bacterium]
MLEQLSSGFVELRREEVLETIKMRIEKGEAPLSILDDARQGMILVGDQFQEGILFLAEMMLASEIFKESVAILKPYMDQSRPSKSKGKIILATLKGDIHDLGKNILSTLLEGQGFQVFDLGVDVEPTVVLEKAKEIEPDFIGFSALITTVFKYMRDAADLLEKEGLRDKIKLMVGGGVTNNTLKEHLNADFQTTDAMAGVAYCLKMMEERQHA